jgi:NAD(P)-dependent dehydrogenase (short-subunit alcohol dehydrogenase family)
VTADLAKVHGDKIRTVKLDVTSPDDVRARAVEVFGPIDVVVNNAGYGFIGAFEEMTSDEFKGQIDTNFWGVVHGTREVLPLLHKQGTNAVLAQSPADFHLWIRRGHRQLGARKDDVGPGQAKRRERSPASPVQTFADVLWRYLLLQPPLHAICSAYHGFNRK